jgi:CRISPR-associated protein Csb2
MRIILRQTFPLGRFHATPWKVSPYDDPHGEWPPSPWRLLRALLARSFQYRREGGDASDAQQAALAGAFASSTIEWHLPPASWRGPGLRQYQPAEFQWNPAAAKEPGMKGYKTTKVMDAFWLTDRSDDSESEGALWWFLDGPAWTDETLALLDSCAARLTYFGRAESITELARITDTNTPAPMPNCTLTKQRKQGAVPVLALAPEATLTDALRSTDSPELANGDLPPGACWSYAQRPDRPTTRPMRKPEKQRPPVQWMQFALGSRIPIYEKSAVTLTQRFRGAAAKCLLLAATDGNMDDWTKAPPEMQELGATLTGKDADGKPLIGHRHAVFFLHFEGGEATRLCAWSADGFTHDEQIAMLRASEREVSLTYKKSSWAAKLIPLDGLVPPPPGIPQTGAQCWKSMTPYVPPRHVFDRRGKVKRGESVAEQIAEELANREFPTATVEIEEGSARWVKVHQPSRTRDGATNDDKRGYTVRITFSEPVKGPIFLGHSCHFGLGLFQPILSSGAAQLDESDSAASIRNRPKL